MKRRSFLAGLAVAFAAPALVRAASLDFVPRGLALPPWPWVLQENGWYTIPRGSYVLHKPLVIKEKWKALIDGCDLDFQMMKGPAIENSGECHIRHTLLIVEGGGLKDHVW